VQAVVIGIKTYKVSLKLTMTTSDGESFEQDIDIVIDADSREEAKCKAFAPRCKLRMSESHPSIMWAGR
tara:strand:+ start:265 stop:471 length:207 start_codon:yes stop_codon:yes gene_type:complete